LKTVISFFVFTGLTLGPLSAAHAAGAKGFSPLKLDGLLVKWGKAELGTPAHVTYAFIESPFVQDNARNCRSMDSVDRLARHTGYTSEEIRKEAAAAFRLWEDASGLTFEEVGSIGAANIVVGVQSLPRGYAFTNVQYDKDPSGIQERAVGGDRGLNRPGLELTEEKAFSGEPKIAEITRSAVCLNPVHNWKIGFDGDLKSYDLRYTFAHEIGHAIGLDHYLRGSSIMHFKYREEFRALQASDIEGVQWLYGPKTD